MNLPLNKRVAELRGWTNLREVPVTNTERIVLMGTNPEGFELMVVPNYSGDLNAIHEAVLTLPDEKQGIFRIHLSDLIHPGSGFSKLGHACVMSKESYTAWFNASASQRCEAFIRTMEGGAP